MSTLLQDKTAIIYGGGGNLGSGVARAFAREGATVYVAGRTRDPLERVAAGIAAAGGRAHASVLDALDPDAVDAHADAVAAAEGGIDVSFNLVTRGDLQGTPITDMAPDDYARAITAGVLGSFITARAAARHMAGRGSGVILHLTSGSSRGAAPLMGNTGPADAAVESLMRYLAVELGPRGIRVVGIHTAGVRGTLSREAVAEVNPAEHAGPDAIYDRIAQMTLLGRVPEIDQVAATAAFLASDGAGAITSTIVNTTSGLLVG
jgi:NAD(P)-dependent dehydrogenase (short-subunit alcohol dehydrogenase family)